MSSLPSNQRDFIVRELPKTIAVNDSELIFTSGNISCISLKTLDDNKLELVVHLIGEQSWFLNHADAVQFISQFPRDYFAKTPKLAELHLDNLPY